MILSIMNRITGAMIFTIVITIFCLVFGFHPSGQKIIEVFFIALIFNLIFRPEVECSFRKKT